MDLYNSIDSKQNMNRPCAPRHIQMFFDEYSASHPEQVNRPGQAARPKLNPATAPANFICDADQRDWTINSGLWIREGLLIGKGREWAFSFLFLFLVLFLFSLKQ